MKKVLLGLVTLFFLIVFLSKFSLSWSKEFNEILSKNLCDGIPSVPVETMKGFCLGLVMNDFEFPRGILPLDNGEILVVDMGSWQPQKGSLWKVLKQDGFYKKVFLLGGLDRPHAILKSPDGLIYVASADRLSVLKINTNGATLVDVIGGESGLEPFPSLGLHPLKQMAFDKDANLYINIGSASNNCEQTNKKIEINIGECEETKGYNQRGIIRKYKKMIDGGFNPDWEIYASGLRNSMGMAFEPESQSLWQVENSRDKISKYNPNLDDELFPHDELNLIIKGKNYGWPYCYDMGLPSPEYLNHNCSEFENPALLLPAHSAPLGMAFHNGRNLPEFMQKGLFVTLNGYKSTGNRIIYIPFNKDGQIIKNFFNVVYNWDKSNGLPKGAPVDIRVSNDGSLYISDDRNGNLLRLSYIGK